MTVFHFCFDLNWFGWLKQDFYEDPFWTLQRTAIVSLFLFCAGLGQAVAVEQGQSWQRFWKRWGQVAACAALVSIGSYFMFPRSFIYFGVLHGIAVMLIVVRATAGWGRWLWLSGALAIAMKWIAAWAIAGDPSLDFLNARAWNWLGLVSRKPITEDYVPLIPWLGVMWWGMAAGQWLLATKRKMLEMDLPRATAPLSWLGRWSLTWYMLHQPVMIGALMALKELR
ncbi:heparan-alpha-glucosaminide N-acetyltransferase [Ramlibacter sp. PS4R-6]